MEPITSLEEPLEEPQEDPHRPRLNLFRAAAVLGFLLLVAQLWRLQIVQGEEYRQRAHYNRFRALTITASRGVIYDRSGIQLVRNIPSYAITIIPADLPADPEPVFQRLGLLLKMPAQDIRKLVTPAPQGERLTNDFTPVLIKANVGTEIAFVVEERHLDLPGVHVDVQPIREYLDGPLMAHILGYVGRITKEQYDTLKGDTEKNYGLNDYLGQTGVEDSYEAELRGRPGEKRLIVDSTGREVQTIDILPPQGGLNLRLTIDLALQREITKILSQDIERYGSASAIAIDPRNGQVLAMVHLPTYDNNLFARGISQEEYEALISDPRHPLLNGAISGAYPPGSSFKIVTAAGALQEQVVQPWTKLLDDKGFIAVPNQYDPSIVTIFSDWAAHGEQDIISAIANSCNVYFYQIGGGDPKGEWDGLGVERLSAYARLFGMGEPTGIDLPNEAAGVIPTPKWKRENYKEAWYKGDTYNMAIGQGFVTITPLQLLNALVAIANGGTLYRPQVVLEVTDDRGNVLQPFRPQVIRAVPVSRQYLEVIQQGLRAGMLIGRTPYGTQYTGTSYTAEVPGARMAGKTGTAEYGVANEEGKLPTHGWFVAFAPVEEPVFAVVVFVERGRGAQDAAALAAKIVRYYFAIPEEKKG